jgi:hypothetical protein
MIFFNKIFTVFVECPSDLLVVHFHSQEEFALDLNTLFDYHKISLGICMMDQ